MQADVFSVGVVAYILLAGDYPFGLGEVDAPPGEEFDAKYCDEYVRRKCGPLAFSSEAWRSVSPMTIDGIRNLLQARASSASPSARAAHGTSHIPRLLGRPGRSIARASASHNGTSTRGYASGATPPGLPHAALPPLYRACISFTAVHSAAASTLRFVQPDPSLRQRAHDALREPWLAQHGSTTPVEPTVLVRLKMHRQKCSVRKLVTSCVVARLSSEVRNASAASIAPSSICRSHRLRHCTPRAGSIRRRPIGPSFHLGRPAAQEKHGLKTLFQKWDTDGSGQIDVDEMKRGLSASDCHLSCEARPSALRPVKSPFILRSCVADTSPAQPATRARVARADELSYSK